MILLELGKLDRFLVVQVLPLALYHRYDLRECPFKVMPGIDMHKSTWFGLFSKDESLRTNTGDS